MSTLLRNGRRYDGTVIDLLVEAGRIVSHVHFGQWALVSRRLDVSGAGSAAESAALVRDEVAKHPPQSGAVLIGQGFRDGLWPDVPTAELLDLGDAAVALVSADVHCTWTNAAALRLLNLPADAWLLREKDAFDLNVRLSAVPDARLDGWALEAAATAASRGVVGVVDLEMSGAVHRRLAQHANRLVLRLLPGAVRSGCCRHRDPLRRRAARPRARCPGARIHPHHPCHRRSGHDSRARHLRGVRPTARPLRADRRQHRARAAGDRGRPAAVRPVAGARQRATRARHGRPRGRRSLLGGPHRSSLRLPSALGGGRRARARLRRAGGAARPLGHELGGGVTQP
jgi:hypothetical protein